MTLVPQSFFARECLDVARDLLGRHLVHGPVTLRITEVEAYRWAVRDTANHCRAGRTARNAPMWGPPGHAYVYLCYGIHHMLNVVTDGDGEGAAVLVRAAECVEGLDVVRARRGDKRGPVLLTGPGKIGQALALDGDFNHHPLFAPGGLELREGEPVQMVLSGPRVGIDYAEPDHRDAPWRLAAGGTKWVSRRRTLRPVDTQGA